MGHLACTECSEGRLGMRPVEGFVGLAQPHMGAPQTAVPRGGPFKKAVQMEGRPKLL